MFCLTCVFPQKLRGDIQTLQRQLSDIETRQSPGAISLQNSNPYSPSRLCPSPVGSMASSLLYGNPFQSGTMKLFPSQIWCDMVPCCSKSIIPQYTVLINKQEIVRVTACTLPSGITQMCMFSVMLMINSSNLHCLSCYI